MASAAAAFTKASGSATLPYRIVFGANALWASDFVDHPNHPNRRLHCDDHDGLPPGRARRP